MDELHYTFTGPTSVTFNWRGAATVIRYGRTPRYGKRAVARGASPAPFSSPGPFREARLGRLEPGAAYHYSIGGGRDQVFRTAPTGRFRFIAMADVGSSLKYPEVTVVQRQVASDNPSFVLAIGDLTYGNSHGQAVVDRHFNDVMAWSRKAAYMPAWGNHEWDKPEADDLRNYKGRFAIPNPQSSPGSPPAGCCGEDWGWFDAGPVRFISYPEPYSGATWKDWQLRAGAVMAAAQADSRIRFIVTFGHRPAYSTGHHDGSGTLAGILDGFGDVYSKYVLSLNGHSHDYERFQPIHGVTHITTGGGGAGLETPWEATDSRTAYRAMRLGYVRVDVASAELRVQAICGPPTDEDDITCSLGEVIDASVIRERP